MRPLELAEVLAAGNDLLSWIAAFLEIDAADQFEIDHLRDEFLLRSRRDVRHAAIYFCQLPG